MILSSKGVPKGIQGGSKGVNPDQILIHLIILVIAWNFNRYASWWYQKHKKSKI